MKNLLRILLASGCACALLANPAFADKPVGKGKPESAGNTSAEAKDKSDKGKPETANSIEAQIKATESRDAAAAASEEAKLKANLFKEVRDRDGFTNDDRKLLKNYESEAGKGSWKNVSSLPPGLQKKIERGGSLPPGWQKKLGLGDTIPNDIYEYRRPLPKDIYDKYPHPPGTDDILIEDQVYRISKKTRQIIDILSE